IGRRRRDGPGADTESSGGESDNPETRMKRDFPEAIHVRLRAEELRTRRATLSKICRLIPSATPDPLNDANREGVAAVWGEGRASPAGARSCRGSPVDSRGMKATAEPLSASGRRAPFVAGDLSCVFSKWRSAVCSLSPFR